MTKTKASPFSFDELLAHHDGGGGGDDTNKDNGASPAIRTTDVKVIASDGVELAVHVYEPTTTTATTTTTTTATATTTTPAATAVLVFYHGGGAHAGAGYQHLARGLCEAYDGVVEAVYLPDIRGHGSSGGPRGDAPSREQVWRDVDTVLAFVAETHNNKNKNNKKNNNNSGVNILLGGHSSGGGLVVNYATEFRKRQQQQQQQPPPVPIRAYALVSPELGYRSDTARPGRVEFAEVSVLAFVLNAIFGILGHYKKAVVFRYPPELLSEDSGMVGFNTVHMANAITPESPREQMLALTTATTTTTTTPEEEKDAPHAVPVGLWIGSEDELFVAESVAAFVTTGNNNNNNNNNNNKNVSEILPGKNHLGILVGIHEPIGEWITTILH